MMPVARPWLPPRNPKLYARTILLPRSMHTREPQGVRSQPEHVSVAIDELAHRVDHIWERAAVAQATKNSSLAKFGCPG